MVICLERDADLHMAQLMPLPLTVSCSSKIQIGFTFLVPAHPGSPGQRAVKWVCVCVYNWFVFALCIVVFVSRVCRLVLSYVLCSILRPISLKSSTAICYNLIKLTHLLMREQRNQTGTRDTQYWQLRAHSLQEVLRQ